MSQSICKESHKSLQKYKSKITFPTINTIYNLLRTQYEKKDKYLHNGIYSIKSLSLNKTYDGQTGRNLSLRFLEHLQYIRKNNPHSEYAILILNHEHKFGTKQDTVDLTMTTQEEQALTAGNQNIL
jgi:hypothetical protein